MNSEHTIKNIAVIGAGVMGAGIAAQAANGGANVLLLDIVPEGAENRNVVAQGAVDRFIKAGCSGGLMHPSIAERIKVGNTEDHFDQLSDYDWIIEVIVERLDIKQSLYRRIATVRNPNCIVSSNTSTIPLEKLVEGMPEDFCQHFVITHYFNPPRHMRLVEIVAGEHSLPAIVDRVSRYNDYQMGKTVIHCADRPGFIGNRLGVYWMQVALQEAIKMGLSVEEADAVMAVCGFPKTGIFGLWDLVGVDLMPSVTESLASLLPASDDFSPYGETVNTIKGMLEKGYLGRKGRTLQGFYRQHKDDKGKRIREVIDLNTLDYRPPKKPTLASCKLKPGQIKELINSPDIGGEYAWKVLSLTLAYATQLIPDVATDTVSFDKAMQLGYNWRWGPFEIIDIIGGEQFCQRLESSNIKLSVFLRQLNQRPVYTFEGNTRCSLNAAGDYQAISTAEGILSLSEIKRQQTPLHHSPQCDVWDLQDNVWCLELSSRVPALNTELLGHIDEALTLAIEADKALIFYSEGAIFLAGADLKEFLTLFDSTEKTEAYLLKGQQLFLRLQQASVPIVGAVAGKALGGGLELLLHCHTIQAHAEASVGLVENQVGIVPGWGGCKELLRRTAERFGEEQAVALSYNAIQTSKVTASAIEAQQMGIFRSSDCISMNLDRLLFDAKQQALTLRNKPFQLVTKLASLPKASSIEPSSEGFQAFLETELLALLNRASSENWYDNFFQYERECNAALTERPESKARMQHFIDNGKPLRN